MKDIKSSTGKQDRELLRTSKEVTPKTTTCLRCGASYGSGCTGICACEKLEEVPQFKIGARVRIKDGREAGRIGEVYDTVFGESKIQLEGDGAGVWWENDRLETYMVEVLPNCAACDNTGWMLLQREREIKVQCTWCPRGIQERSNIIRDVTDRVLDSEDLTLHSRPEVTTCTEPHINDELREEWERQYQHRIRELESERDGAIGKLEALREGLRGPSQRLNALLERLPPVPRRKLSDETLDVLLTDVEEDSGLPEPEACSDPSMIMSDEKCLELVCSRPKAARNLINLLTEKIRKLQAEHNAIPHSDSKTDPEVILRRVRDIIEAWEGAVHSHFGALAVIRDEICRCSLSETGANSAKSSTDIAIQASTLKTCRKLLGGLVSCLTKKGDVYTADNISSSLVEEAQMFASGAPSFPSEFFNCGEPGCCAPDDFDEWERREYAEWYASLDDSAPKTIDRVPTDAAVVLREDFKPDVEAARDMAEKTRALLASRGKK